jgi:hypothetical protein
MLVGADNRGINPGVCISGIFGQMCKNALPDTAFSPAAMVSDNVVPISKTVRQKSKAPHPA